MPRKRKYDTVNEFHIQRIARRADLLRIDLDAASNTVKPFNEHYNALEELRRATFRCENILRGLPPEHVPVSMNSTPTAAS